MFSGIKVPKFETDLPLFKNLSCFKVTNILNVLSFMFNLLRLFGVKKRDVAKVHSLRIQHYQYEHAHVQNSHLWVSLIIQITSEKILTPAIWNPGLQYEESSALALLVDWAFLTSWTVRGNWNSKSIFFCSTMLIKSWNMIFSEDKNVFKNIHCISI